MLKQSNPHVQMRQFSLWKYHLLDVIKELIQILPHASKFRAKNS